MQAKVKVIPNEEFTELALLYIELGKVLACPLTSAQSLYTLTHDLANQTDFIALGLYEEGELNGFITGYAISKKTFYFSGLYVKIKNKNATLLINESLRYIEDMGYSGWEADSNQEQMSSILIKYGAKQLYVRFKKGADNG